MHVNTVSVTHSPQRTGCTLRLTALQRRHHYCCVSLTVITYVQCGGHAQNISPKLVFTSALKKKEKGMDVNVLCRGYVCKRRNNIRYRLNILSEVNTPRAFAAPYLVWSGVTSSFSGYYLLVLLNFEEVEYCIFSHHR